MSISYPETILSITVSTNNCIKLKKNSRTFKDKLQFKDFQGPTLSSSTFKALNLEKKNPGLSRMCGNPDQR